jgi:hypothetical protein
MKSNMRICFFVLVVITFDIAKAATFQCGSTQSAINDRFNTFISENSDSDPGKLSNNPIPPIANIPDNNRGAPSVPSNPPVPRTSTPDTRGTESHWYDASQVPGYPLSPRERRQAEHYEQAVRETRNTTVSYNDPTIGSKQKQEIEQILKKYEIKYDKATNSIPPTKSSSNKIGFEDRVRKIIYDTMKGPITDINMQMEVMRDRISNLESIIAAMNDKGKGPGKLRKIKMPNGRMVASIPNAVPPEKASLNPLDLDEIVNKALYVRDGAHWEKSGSLSEKESKDPISKGSIAKEIYKTIAIGDGTELRVLELVNNKDEVIGIKIFIYRPDKHVWVPVFYKPDPTTQQFARQEVYHGQRLPYACINCHGGSLRKMGPQVELSNWKK